MQLNFKKDILPHLAGLVIFYLIVLFYFSPLVFDGKIIFQYDILQWEGTAKAIMDYRSDTGEEALWADRLFSGMPAYLVSYEISGDLSNYISAVMGAGLPHPINALFVGMWAMYALLLTFRVRPEFSIAGAIAFAFNSFHLISLHAGHNAKIWAICLIPLIFTGIQLAFQRKYLMSMAIFALGLLMQLKFNHLQITYYTLLMVLIYGIFHLVYAYREKAMPVLGKSVLLLSLGAVLAIGGNLGRILSVLEYSPYSTRGPSNLTSDTGSSKGLDRDYAFNWSQGKLETLTLLVPYLYGGGSGEALPKDSNSENALRSNGIDNAQIKGFVEKAPTYWGEQPGTGGPIYGSAILLFLLILGIIYAPKREKGIFLTIIALSLVLVWGKNMAWLNDLLFDFLPGYNKFRAVTMAFCMTLFAIPVLGSIGLEKFFSEEDEKRRLKSLLIALGATAGLALILWILAGLFAYRAPVDANLPDWLSDALRLDRKSLLRSSALKSVLMIALAAAAIYAAWKNKISIFLAGLSLAVLVLIDLWSINRRYLNEDDFRFSPSNEFFTKTPADEKILQDKGYFRVLNLDNPFNEARTSYFFNSIGGYHGAKMKRYQELIENAVNPEMQEFIQKAQEGDFYWEGIPVLNMLNTKYLLAGRAENAVFLNPQTNGNAWFPEEIIPVNTEEEDMQTIRKMDSKRSATVNQGQYSIPEAGSGRAILADPKPNHLTYEIDAQKAGFLVLSEIYYPKGWKAFTDGVEVPIIRTNYLLRGVEVPNGQSKLELKFEPNSYKYSKDWTLFFQGLIFGLLFASFFLWFKKTYKNG